MMEAIQIRQRGFVLREDHDIFFYDYQSLAPDVENIKELVEAISSILGTGKEEGQLGKTNVFLKRAMAFKLRKLEVLRCKSAAPAIQKWVRNMARAEAAIKSKRRHASFKYQRMRADYRLQNDKAVVVQKIALCNLVRRRDLLHSFGDMGPKELDTNIAEMEKAIEDAAKQLEVLQEACKNVKEDLNELEPEELDERIHAMETTIAEAMAARDFGKCGDLQVSLDAHVSARKKKQIPEELDAEIEKLNEKLHNLMTKKQFDKCAQLHKDIDVLKRKRA
ncbi:hypothetical protein F443_09014 [Phytophthora nicotianae P1569]|uniref:Myosin motor domain-containing protein n=1 Tax=Phytophthora nicotianae P1569 TaxID=1317065 RepID=V9F521_PHYNI|nr:hypothetical protein F443_09014 [Phytophthora nicotianae P1569]